MNRPTAPAQTHLAMPRREPARVDSVRVGSLRVVPGPRRDAGFSLLEVLLVMVLIALIASSAVFMIASNEPQKLRNSAREFANRTALVEEEAILSREPWGLQIYRARNEDGDEWVSYRYLRFRGEQGWQPAAPADMAVDGRFASSVIAILEIEGTEHLIEPLPQKDDIEPMIWLAPGGEVTPFELRLRFKDDEEKNSLVVRSDALGRIELDLHKDDGLLK